MFNQSIPDSKVIADMDSYAARINRIYERMLALREQERAITSSPGFKRAQGAYQRLISGFQSLPQIPEKYLLEAQAEYAKQKKSPRVHRKFRKQKDAAVQESLPPAPLVSKWRAYKPVEVPPVDIRFLHTTLAFFTGQSREDIEFLMLGALKQTPFYELVKENGGKERRVYYLTIQDIEKIKKRPAYTRNFDFSPFEQAVQSMVSLNDIDLFFGRDLVNRVRGQKGILVLGQDRPTGTIVLGRAQAQALLEELVTIKETEDSQIQGPSPS